MANGTDDEASRVTVDGEAINRIPRSGMLTAGTARQYPRSSEYLLMNCARRTRLKFFNFISSASASDLVGFSVCQTKFHGLPERVEFS